MSYYRLRAICGLAWFVENLIPHGLMGGSLLLVKFDWFA